MCEYEFPIVTNKKSARMYTKNRSYYIDMFNSKNSKNIEKRGIYVSFQ